MVFVNDMVLTAAASVGWIGAAGTVGAYAMVSSRRLDAHSVRFQMVNIVGGGLLAISALSTDNWPSAVSNLIWMYFGLHGLFASRATLQAAAVDRWRAMRVEREHRRTTLSADGEERAADEVILAA
jgi:hypothetical protein